MIVSEPGKDGKTRVQVPVIPALGLRGSVHEVQHLTKTHHGSSLKLATEYDAFQSDHAAQ